MSTLRTRGMHGWMMVGALVGFGLLLSGIPVASVAAEPPPEWDGLLRVPDKGADHLYLLRDAGFANYTAVSVAPIQVSFDATQNAGRRNPRRMLSDSDMEQLRTSLAHEFHSAFESKLMQAGYTVTSEAGDHVLSVTPQIINLYITSPKQVSGRNDHYVTNTGHMTLVLELRDSVSGQLLGRVVDTLHGQRAGRFVLASPISNLADARAALNQWADMTLTALNYAKQSSATAEAEGSNGKNSESPR